MIVVIASRGDDAAHRVAARWGAERARVLTAADLTAPGWRVYTHDPASSRARVQGEILATDDITGVLTRAPAFTERELPMLAEEDRSYAATEMTAFLVYWLTSLDCPVLNPPSAAGMCGPSWRSEKWTLTASGLGLDVEPRQRHIPAFEREATSAGHADPPGGTRRDQRKVTVIGDRCLGTADDELADHARRLARAAGVEMLVVLFGGPESKPRFVDAHPWVDLADDEVADAILAHLSADGVA